MIDELITTDRVRDFSIESMISDQQTLHKRKRESLVKQTSSVRMRPIIDDEEEDYDECSYLKRTTSRNASVIFTTASEDSERRDNPAEDAEEDDFDNALSLSHYRHNSIFRRDDECEDEQEKSELLLDKEILSSSLKEDNDDDITFSPVSAFFHPAILRATTICESASDIFPCGEPPEVDSRPVSPQADEVYDDHFEPVKSSHNGKMYDSEFPSWLNGTPRAFNWAIPAKTNTTPLFGSSPWTGVFQLGSS
ncbi:hypothetical protein HJC23_001380 [Cyclotella cryptica]|uniref:Uncharacterized protein n=1 Tax=Cyclotella cryptica TaxID=29204 RepID=A0ABD3P8P6_9STRA|eukprot:CCRYP_016706-RA/>CCRYP_016706-RA protein AED:0.39 eAED:0.39 QI:0/-1/0/1/-1/1/1/0/250